MKKNKELSVTTLSSLFLQTQILFIEQNTEEIKKLFFNLF